MAARAARYVLRQLFDYETYTFTYLLGCAKTKEAVIIDPVLERVDRDSNLMKDLGLKLKYAVNTHVHADHITGSGKLRSMWNSKSVLSKVSGGLADVYVEDGQLIKFGEQALEVRLTPGHTEALSHPSDVSRESALGGRLFKFIESSSSWQRLHRFFLWDEGVDGCMCLVEHNDRLVFTGDALFYRGCGRTDFSQGNCKNLYESIHKKIFTLDDDFLILPGHDYNGHAMSSVGEEKTLNPRLTKSVDEFCDIMMSLHLPHPKKVEEAIPANLKDGRFDLME